MRNPNKPVPPPWAQDVEEALTAQHQALSRRRSKIPPSYTRSRMRTATILKVGGVVALFFLSFLLLISSRRF